MNMQQQSNRVHGYREVWKRHHGEIPRDELGVSFDIHHIDGNASNNSIENLVALSRLDHFEVHYAQGNLLACRAINCRLLDERLPGWKVPEESIKKRTATRRARGNYTQTPESINKMKETRRLRGIPPPGLGSTPSEKFLEAGRRRAEAKRGTKTPKEVIEKGQATRRERFKGKYHKNPRGKMSEEAKQKMLAARRATLEKRT